MSDVHRRFLLDGVHHSRRKSARKREFAARANQNLSTPGCDQGKKATWSLSLRIGKSNPGVKERVV